MGKMINLIVNKHRNQQIILTAYSRIIILQRILTNRKNVVISTTWIFLAQYIDKFKKKYKISFSNQYISSIFLPFPASVWYCIY